MASPPLGRDRRPVSWPDEIDDIVAGDLTAAFACLTPSGGVVVFAVATCGLRDRAAGSLGYTTSLGMPAKLERIVADPRTALAFHSREHGFAASPRFVLAQGVATVDLAPSAPRLRAFAPQAERFLGPVKRGWLWDWMLREFYLERVFVDVSVVRVSAWPALDASGRPGVFGEAPPGTPPEQDPPARGTRPRVPVRPLAARARHLPHVLIAYRGADGFPVIVPVTLRGHGPDGLELTAAPGVLPPGGRRAGFLAHRYRPRLVGLSTRFGTGWLQVDHDGRAVYAPHTVHRVDAPPVRDLQLLADGLMATHGIRRARRDGIGDRLAGAQTRRPGAPP